MRAGLVRKPKQALDLVALAADRPRDPDGRSLEGCCKNVRRAGEVLGHLCPRGAEFVTFDERLGLGARLEGFRVLPES